MLVGRCVPNANWSSALIGRCALISRADSTVGGQLTNHSYHFNYFLDIFRGRVPRFGGKLCLSWHQLCHAFSSFLLRCFHPTSFKTSLHIISDAKPTSSCIQYCILWQYANIYVDNSTVPRQICFQYRKNLSVIGALLSI